MTFSDSRISKFLQENFIVQWEAVSPVRLVKFDLGEGRSFSGTVNGEIALYFCDSHGEVFDILPALQSPAITLERVKEAHEFYTEQMKKGNQDSGKPLPITAAYRKGISFHQIRKLHRERLKKIAAKRFEMFKKQGIEVMKDPSKIPAALVFPETKKGEEKRDAYIHAAVDEATRDLRIMVRSKIGPPPTYFDQYHFSNESLTVVEPGGLGYYQWQISRAFFGAVKHPKDKPNSYLPTQPLITPQDWKELVFTTIMKQELKGGVVEYNSESLEAIQIIE